MRLHTLEVTAFGPFADTQRVDFDQLTQAGLFLLHGPTGAGKSSLLDAVCFALYGRVPGPRGGSRLRSDHAAASAAPQVRCEFTVAGRRLEVTRSPEWQRPKRRGGGTVTERTHVTLREFKDGGWTSLTHRADEAAERLHELIGLGADQFTKLVLLPQGDFAAFLRASADERRTLLQKLFGTERFMAVEDWLVTRRRELERQLGEDAATTAKLLSRARQALDDELPPPAPSSGTLPGLEAAQPSAAIDEHDAGQVAALVQAWASWSHGRLGSTKQQASGAEQEFDRLRRAHEQAAENARLQARFSQLSDRLGLLEEQQQADTQRQARWTAARSAVVLTPLLDRLRELDAARGAAAGVLADAGNDLPAGAFDGDETDPGQDELRQRAGALRAEVATLAELAAVETELAVLGQQHGRCRSDLVMAQSQHQRADQELATLTTRESALLTGLNTAAALAAALPERQQAAARAAAVHRAVLEDEQLGVQQPTLVSRLQQAVDRHQAAVAATLDLRERRLAGMAAELASSLADGDACPVCGGLEHPRPAEPGAEQVTRDAEQAVQAAQQRAERQRRDAEAAVAGLERQRAAAQAVSANLPAAASAALLRDARSAADQAQSAVDTHADLTHEQDVLQQQVAAARARREAASQQAERARLELAAVGSRIETLQAPVTAARGDDDDLASRRLRLQTIATALEHLLDARRDERSAAARYGEQLEVTQQAARAAGFDDVAAASAAWLDDGEQQRLRDRIEAYRAERSAVAAQLSDPRFAGMETSRAATDPGGPGDPGDPGDAGEPADQGTTAGLERSAAAVEAARDAAQQAASVHTLAVQASHALSALAIQLRQHAVRGAPLRERFATLDAVARAAAGGGDNALRMRLSSYVLAARLEQVAEAASVRLSGMSGGRYTLVHTDGPARGGARSGLGLAVVDGWSGTQRDPGSLSGGETFCTALALALGLADVVQAEAGGAVIETLLVDEGFGSLDADTLDEVMDVLDALRSGGRCVGLVSHVADLRDRIPARLEVVKTRTGSHLVA